MRRGRRDGKIKLLADLYQEIYFKEFVNDPNSHQSALESSLDGKIITFENVSYSKIYIILM